MKDSIFGELTFSVGWNKKEYINIFNKDVGIRVDCYENEFPNQKQQFAYKYFVDNQNDFLVKLQKEIYNYIVQNKQSIVSETEIFNFIAVEEILFLDDGKFMIIFKTNWDTHNSAILFSNKDKIIVATEDIVVNYI